MIKYSISFDRQFNVRFGKCEHKNSTGLYRNSEIVIVDFLFFIEE